MTSAINPLFPTEGQATTSSVRANFSAAKTEIDALQIRDAQIGFIDYNDTFTTGTPISVPGTSTFVKLTNNALGSFTNYAYKPTAIANNIWDTTTNQFVWTRGMKLGDMMDIRTDIQITTTGANQAVTLSLFLAVGGSEYELPINAQKIFKTAGTYRMTDYYGIYIGNTDTLNNVGELRIKSDASATVVVNGWYTKFILIGAHP